MSDKIKILFKRYRFVLVMLVVNTGFVIFEPNIGISAFKSTWDSLVDMMSFMPPVFVLIGLLDEWVDRETLIKYMGDDSGIKGMVLALVLGSVSAGPLYVAFPFCMVLMRKGIRMMNMYILIFAWCTTKVHHLLFESANLGVKFMLARLACNIVGMVIIAFIMEKTSTDEEKNELYARAEANASGEPPKKS